MGTRLGTVLGTQLGTSLGTDIGGGASELPAIYGIGSIAAADRYTTPLDGLPFTRTDVPPMGAIILVRPDVTAVSVARCLLGKVLFSITRGFGVRVTGTNGSIQTTFVNGAAGNINAPLYTIPAAERGKWHHVAAWHDGAFVRLAVQGVQVGAGTAITGYTPTIATDVGGFGHNTSTNPATDSVIAGMVCFTGAISVADVLANYNATKLALDVVPSIGTATVVNHHSVKLDQLGVAPANITDRVGGSGSNFVKIGSPALVVDTAYQWAV